MSTAWRMKIIVKSNESNKNVLIAKSRQPNLKIFLNEIWYSSTSKSTMVLFPEFNLIKESVILFGEYIQESNKKNIDYDSMYASLELSLVAIFRGLETCLNKFLLERKNKLKKSKNQNKLVTRKANLHEMLNILGENSFIWNEEIIDNRLLKKLRDSYNKHRIKIIYPNSKAQNYRMFYPFSKREYLQIFDNTNKLLNLIYYRSSLDRRRWLSALDNNLSTLSRIALRL